MSATSANEYITECDAAAIQPSAPQRQCLSHILRNCASTLENAAHLLEAGHEICPHELVDILVPVNVTLSRVIDAGRGSSFCALAEECSFVAPFVGCCGRPQPSR